MNLSKNKKIIFSSNASWYLWNFRRNLMRELKQDGYEIVTTSAVDEYSNRLAQEFSFIPMRFLNRTDMNPIKDFLLFIEYLFVYYKQKPDMVMNLTIKPNIYSSLACRCLGIPYVATITGLGSAFIEKKWLERLVLGMYRSAFKKIKKVMFQNEENRALFVSSHIIDQEKTVMVPGSGVDLERFYPTPLPSRTKNPTFLLMARMLRDKGVEVFFNAAQMVRRNFPEVRFILAGPLDEKNSSGVSISEIQSWHDTKSIEYVGLVDDVRHIIGITDVVVLPSWYPEGVPKSLLEAMAMGRPIITTDVPGCRSVVVNGFNGFLIQPKSVKALVEAMENMILLSLEQRQAMGDAGRVMVIEKFDQRIVFGVHRELINGILEK